MGSAEHALGEENIFPFQNVSENSYRTPHSKKSKRYAQAHFGSNPAACPCVPGPPHVGTSHEGRPLRQGGKMVKITSSERVGSARPPGPQPKAERGLASRGTRFIRDPARFCAEQPKFWTPPPGSPLRGSPIVEEPKGWGPLPFFHPGHYVRLLPFSRTGKRKTSAAAQFTHFQNWKKENERGCTNRPFSSTRFALITGGATAARPPADWPTTKRGRWPPSPSLPMCCCPQQRRLPLFCERRRSHHAPKSRTVLRSRLFRPFSASQERRA